MAYCERAKACCYHEITIDQSGEAGYKANNLTKDFVTCKECRESSAQQRAEENQPNGGVVFRWANLR